MVKIVTHRIILINEYISKGLGTMNRQINTATASHGKLNTAMSTTNKKSGDMLRSFTRFRWTLVNVALAAALAYGAFRVLVKPAIDLETSMADVRKTTGYTIEEIDRLKGSLISLSTKIPVSAIELAKIATVAGQLGLGKEGAKSIEMFTETVAMMAIATELTAEEAAKALAKVSQAFDLPISTVNRLGSVINELSNTTAATSKEIVSSLTRTAAAAHNLGLSAPFIAALGSTLVSAGMRSERAGTRMRSALTQMTSGVEKFAKLTGIAIPKFRMMLETDAEQALLLVLRTLNEYESSTRRAMKTTELFGRVGGTAIQTLVGNYDKLIENLRTANSEWEQHLSLLEETSVRMSTTISQWELFVNIQKEGILSQDAWFNSLLKFINAQSMSYQIARKARKEIKEGELRRLILEEGDGDILIWELGRLKKELKELMPPETYEKFIKMNYALETTVEKILNARLALSEYNTTTIGALESLEKEIDALEVGSDAWDIASLAIAKANSELRQNGEISKETADLLRSASEYVIRKKEADESAIDAVEKLTERQKAHNEELKLLRAEFALGIISEDEFKEGLARIKEEYKGVIKYQELMREGLEANTTAVQDFYKETGILVDSLNELRILQELMAKGVAVEKPGRPKPTYYGEEMVETSPGVWEPPPPPPPTYGPGAVHPLERDDFISRPGQPIQRFNPQDTIVGVKDTGKAAGGTTVGDVQIIIQGYNKDQKALAIEVQRQMKSLA